MAPRPAPDDTPPRYLEVPGPCDLACAWCNVGGVAAMPTGGDLERVTSRLEALARDGRLAGVGFGLNHTEPTTHPDLLELIRRARALGFARISLATSGLSLARREVLRAVVEAGVTEVSLTLPTVDEGLGDLLLGVRGSTSAKLRALEACRGEAIVTHAMLMLLRPTLHRVADDVAALAALALPVRGSRRAGLHLHGCLPERVPGMAPGRFALLWPEPGELAWAMKRARARVPGFAVHASDLPLCVAERIPGLRVVPPAPFRKGLSAYPGSRCDRCDRMPLCPGVPIEDIASGAAALGEVQEREPAAPDHEALAQALEACVRHGGVREASGAPPDEAGDGSPGWQREALARLKPLLGGKRRLSGFAVRSAWRARASISLLMGSADDETVEAIVELAAEAPRFFVAGRRFAVSYRADSRPTSPARAALLHALLALLERPIEGPRGEAES